MTDLVTDGWFRDINVERTGRMVLNPLTEVRIGMLMPVSVGRRQFVVHVLRDSKGGKSKEDTDNT